MLVPKLRFKREDGTEYSDWEKKKIGDLLSLCHGKDYKHLGKGDIPVMGTGGIITYVDEALCDWECVCIGRKGTIDRPYYMDKPFWSVDTLFYSKPKKGNLPKFQYYLFQNINWHYYNEASGVPSLSASTIEKIRVIVPCLEEQQKIADFLSTVDEVIAQSEAEVQNLEQQKKAAMQKIFSQEVRFKREDGTDYPEWTTTSLKDVCDIIGGGTPSTENSDYWNGDIQWFTPSEIGMTKYVSKSARTISQIGFEKSSARKLPVGTILLTSRATLGEMAIATTECTTNQGFQSLIPQRINGEYLYYLQPAIKNYCNKKACGSTFNEISKVELGKCKIPIPAIEEQQKIANFLSTYDEAISYAKQELDKWKELKKGLLQQMFV